MVQWLRLHTPDAGSLGLIPGQGTRSHMPQLKSLHAAANIPHAATKIQCFFKSNNFPKVKAMSHQIQKAYWLYKSWIYTKVFYSEFL